MSVTSDGSFQVLITSGTTSFQQFQDDVLAKCNKQFEDSGELIRNSMATRSPRLDWKVSMKLKWVDKFKKLASYTVNDLPSFTHWINRVIKSGRDTTTTTLEIVMQNPTTAVKKAKAAMC
jgi:hypothetical protein